MVEAAEGTVPIELDVTDPASVAVAGARVEADPGRLDVLVNNAGVYGDPDRAAEYDLGLAHEVLEVNTFGPWRLIQAFLPLLRESPSPRIVNVSSGAGQLAEMSGGYAAYRLSKAALNALTRTLAADEAGSASPGQRRLPGLGAHRHGRAGRAALGRGGRRHRCLAGDAVRRRADRRVLPRPQTDSLVEQSEWRRALRS